MTLHQQILNLCSKLSDNDKRELSEILLNSINNSSATPSTELPVPSEPPAPDKPKTDEQVQYECYLQYRKEREARVARNREYMARSYRS